MTDKRRRFVPGIGTTSSQVAVVEIVERTDAPGQEAAAERAVGHEPNPELAQRRQELRLRLAREQGILGLDSASSRCP
jgi:hypothetical protein